VLEIQGPCRGDLEILIGIATGCNNVVELPNRVDGIDICCPAVFLLRSDTALLSFPFPFLATPSWRPSSARGGGGRERGRKEESSAASEREKKLHSEHGRSDATNRVRSEDGKGTG
jgi:hypothetical protein